MFYCERTKENTNPSTENCRIVTQKNFFMQYVFWSINLYVCHRNGEHWSLLYRSFIHFRVLHLVETSNNGSSFNGNIEERSGLKDPWRI